jgi:CheY-like chemotaxis protein
MLIEREGYRTLAAYDASTGLQLARDVSPNIIFHDIAMPVINGHMAARQIRSESQFANTLLVALTSYNSPADRTQALLSGFDLHLAKPLHYEELLQVLKQASKE